MTTTRDVGDISTNPGGKSGAEWTTDVRDSLRGLWGLNGGVAQNVAGTNAITADAEVATGLSALTNGLRVTLVAAATNTGPTTFNYAELGEKALVDKAGDANAAAALVLGQAYTVEFFSDDDHWRVLGSAGTTNVTIEGGIQLKRSTVTRLAVALGPATVLTAVLSKSFACGFTTSRVIIEGAIVRTTGAGTIDPDGVVVHLYVDDVDVESFTDAVMPNVQAATPFYFEHEPGDTDAHSYEIRVESTIAATYPAGSNHIFCSELAPNS